MADQDMIQVWNEETSEMFDPGTIHEALRAEHNNGNAEGRSGMDQYSVDQDPYGHLVFMRNTGIYEHPSKVEIFAEDLITHSDEQWLYRVTQKRGCWWAMSLRPDVVPARLLNSVYDPHIVGNAFENMDLVLKGEIEVR